MRILLACEFYYPSVGGVQEVMRQLGERFAQSGHEVIVATTRLPQRRSCAIGGVSVEEFRVWGNLANGMGGEVERYRQFVLRQDYDVLMIKAAQQWTFDALIPVLGAIKRSKVFIPCGFSGLFDPRYAEYFRRMPFWLREFDRLIFYASDYRDINFARDHGLKNVVLLSNGADEREFNIRKDPAFRARYNISDNAFAVLTVGSLTGLKGHLEVAQAFERCNFGSRPACLILCGNNPGEILTDVGLGEQVFMHLFRRARAVYEGGGKVRLMRWFLRAMLVKLGFGWLLTKMGYDRTHLAVLKETVRRINRIPGRQALIADLPRAELLQAYLNCDLFVFASQVEYSPLVLFEAAAAGLPFVSVPVGNAAEIAEWTGGGVICGATLDAKGLTRVDPAILAKKIDELAAQPELLAVLGATGKDRWQERFTWQKVFRLYEKVLEDCLEKAPT